MTEHQKMIRRPGPRQAAHAEVEGQADPEHEETQERHRSDLQARSESVLTAASKSAKRSCRNPRWAASRIEAESQRNPGMIMMPRAGRKLKPSLKGREKKRQRGRKTHKQIK